MCEVVSLGKQRCTQVNPTFAKHCHPNNHLPPPHYTQKQHKTNVFYVLSTHAKRCAIVESVGRVLLLIHSRNWTNNSKKEGFGGAQHTQKVIPRTNLPLFGLQHAPTSPLSNPPRSAPILALCPPLWRCTVCQDNNHSKQGRQRPNGGRQKFFFPRTNRFCDLSPYNRLLAIQHCSVFSFTFFFKKIKSDNICF